MGYRKKVTVLKLVFEDHEGLEVRMRSVPLGPFLDISKLAEMAGDSYVPAPQDVEKIDQLFTAFAEYLIDWNLEDEDGTPVPATLEGVRKQDFDFALLMVMEWIQAAAGVPSPLERPSNSAGTSQEVSLPMEPLSPSLAS